MPSREADDEPTRNRAVVEGRRMSDVEAVMWHVEKDPFLSSTFGSISMLAAPPDMDRLRRRLVNMVVAIPRLHQRVAPTLGRLAPPEWQDDPEFDMDRHLRRVALPAPGSIEQLHELAIRLVQDPFDRTRPLWEFVVVEGLEDGRAALVQKMHHTITDGVGGIRMSAHFIDVAADAPDPDPIDESVLTRDVPPASPNPLAAAADVVTHSFGQAVDVAGSVVGGLADALRHPTELVGLPFRAAAAVPATVQQVVVIDDARSPLWTTRSLFRWFSTLDVDFDDAYRAAKALGGSLNDLFVAGAAGGAGAYHRRFGAPVTELRMAMPVNTRARGDRSAAGNSFVPTRVLVPTDIDAPGERLAAIHDLLSATRSTPALGIAEQVAGLANLVPTTVLTKLARRQVETIDFTTSNVKAAPFDLFIGGARLEGTYPLGPLAGTAFNLTMMSYAGTLNMGLHVDRGAIEHPEVLRACLVDAFDELIAAGG